MKKAILTPLIINLIGYLFLFVSYWSEKDVQARGFQGLIFIPIVLVAVVIANLIVPILIFFFHDKQYNRQSKLIHLLVYYLVALFTAWFLFWQPLIKI